jgi:hypothetical protein
MRSSQRRSAGVLPRSSAVVVFILRLTKLLGKLGGIADYRSVVEFVLFCSVTSFDLPVALRASRGGSAGA